MIMTHHELNARVDSGAMFWQKTVTFPSGAAEMTTVRVPEARLRWLNNELPRKQKVCPITVEWARGKSKMEIAAEVERIAQAERDAKAEKSLKTSIARARTKVRHQVKAIGGDHMMTLTYRENVQDVEQVKRDWQEFVRLVRLERADWQFVAVPELQDRGAYHLHVAISGRQDLKHLRRCWYRALGGKGDEVGGSTPGQIDVSGPQKRWRVAGSAGLKWDANKLASYMTKYIGKSFDKSIKGAKRYWHSKGVKAKVVSGWLAATSWNDAVRETYSRLEMYGHFGLDVRARPDDGIIWLSAAHCDEDYCPF